MIIYQCLHLVKVTIVVPIVSLQYPYQDIEVYMYITIMWHYLKIVKIVWYHIL